MLLIFSLYNNKDIKVKGEINMSFIETIKQRAKQDIKTIVLPEGNDIRTIEGAKNSIRRRICKYYTTWK